LNIVLDKMLTISHLCVRVGNTRILQDFSLSIAPGQVHAIMGPNGTGKSTLVKVLAGHPCYEIESGSVTFLGKDLLALSPEERVHTGLFLSYQTPVEVPGVSTDRFLRAAFDAKRKATGLEPIAETEFRQILEARMSLLQTGNEEMLRELNVGCSGGEKKRNEIMQMAILEPQLALLDEIDSGLDIDALKMVSKGVNAIMRGDNKSMLLITHYQRLLEYIVPDFVHVMVDGRIVESGGAELALHLEEHGYEQLQGALV